MSFSWTTTGVGFDADDPRDVHSLSCQIWESPDPADGFDCGATGFQTGVEQWIDRFERYAAPQHGRAS